MQILNQINKFHSDESGQDLVEYALVLAAIAVAVVGGSSTLSSTLNNAIGALNNKIVSAIG